MVGLRVKAPHQTDGSHMAYRNITLVTVVPFAASSLPLPASMTFRSL
jgi:hypothetical protein